MSFDWSEKHILCSQSLLRPLNIACSAMRRNDCGGLFLEKKNVADISFRAHGHSQ